MHDLKGKKALVIGLGKSGISAARYLASEGSIVTAADLKSASALPAAMRALDGMQITFALGPHDPKLCRETELVIASPGVPNDLPGLPEARKRGVPIIGELELALCRIKSPIIAVTGTNGKTTTTALLGHLLNGSGVRACVAGNIGTPLLDVLDEAARSDVTVIEVSSFQMETTPSLEPRIAIWLNATPDHLDRHANFDEYVECKARLLKRVPKEGWAIYNVADEVVSRATAQVEAHLVPFDAAGKILGKKSDGAAAWFGKGDLCIRDAEGATHRYPLSHVKLEGIHNRENMLAALVAAMLFGASSRELKAALESFKGLPHRVELVGEHRGVRYYDDSKGTNIGATIRALEGFAEPIVLIAGGLSKGVDFTPLAPQVRARVKRLVLIGEAAGEMESILKNSTKTARASSMEEAVRIATEAAEPGDVVLLSPACASFDMFLDYAERGRAFSAAVSKMMGK